MKKLALIIMLIIGWIGVKAQTVITQPYIFQKSVQVNGSFILPYLSQGSYSGHLTLGSGNITGLDTVKYASVVRFLDSVNQVTYFNPTYFNGNGTITSPFGVVASSVFPSQSGQNGKALFSNGTSTYWGAASSTNIYNSNGTLIGTRFLNGNNAYGLFLDSLATFQANVTSSDFLGTGSMYLRLNGNTGDLAFHYGNGDQYNIGSNDGGGSGPTEFIIGGGNPFGNYASFDWSAVGSGGITVLDNSGYGLTAGYGVDTTKMGTSTNTYVTSGWVLGRLHSLPGVGTTTNALTNGYGIQTFTFNGGTAGITVKADTTALQTVSNFFPKADTRYLKLTGGTLTGALNGTSASFSSDITVNTLTVGLGNGAVSKNTVLGYQGLLANTTGNFNIAIGYQSLLANTSANSNVAIGYKSLTANTTGGANTAVGTSSLQTVTTSSYNTALGYGAGKTNSTGTQNSYVGYEAGYYDVGNYNTYIGTAAGGNSTGSNNTYLGVDAGENSSTGSNNVFLGYYAGLNETGSNKLYIANSSTTTPLIKGDFSAETLQIYGILGSWTPAGSAGTDSVVVKHGGQYYAISPTYYGTGSGTVTSIATSTGILGGTITTSGTLKADTTVLQTVANFFPKGDTRYQKISSAVTVANPTATIGFTAVNGSAASAIRSDGAPKADSTVIRSVANSYSLSAMQTKLNNYALTSSLPVGANPTATAGATVVNGSATTFMRSDAAPKVDSTVFQTVLNFFPKGDTRYLKTSSATSTYVPYTGASGNVTLGSNTISAAQFLSGTLGYTDTGILGALQSSTNGYNQFIIQNTSTGTSASANLIVNNSASTATTNYGEVGINGVNFSNGSGSLNQPGYVYFDATSYDLVVGTFTNNSIHFVTNNAATDAMTISGAGAVSLPNLTSNGLLQTTGGTGAVSVATTTLPSGITGSSLTSVGTLSSLVLGGANGVLNGQLVNGLYTPTATTGIYAFDSKEILVNNASNSTGTFAGEYVRFGTLTGNTFNVSNIYGANYGVIHNGSGTVTASVAFDIATPSVPNGGTITTSHGLLINAQAGTGIGTAYAIYTTGSSDAIYFAGPTTHASTSILSGKVTINPSISASSNLAQTINANPTLTAVANNDVLVDGDFNPTIAGVGIISTLGSVTGGSSYTNGTYTAVPLTGGNGSGAQATVVVSGGAVTTVTITTAGTRYDVNDVLSAAAANIGGTGSGFSVPVATLTQTVTGSPLRATVSNIGQGSSANFNGSWADGLLLYNSTAAVSTLSQNSPVIHLSSFGWGSTGGTSQAVDAFIYSQANTGTVPNANLTFGFGVAGAKTTAAYTFGSGGAATFTSGSLTLTRSSQGATAFNSLIQQNTTAATSGTPNQWTPTWYNEGATWNTSGTPASNSFAFGLIGEGTSSANPYATQYFQTYLGTSTTPTFVNTMSLTTQGQLALGLANTNIQAGSQAGSIFNIGASTLTDNSTASGTVTNFAVIGTGLTTLAATNASITYTNGYGAFFTAPTSGTNVTMTNKYALGLAYDATHLFTVAVNSSGAATLNATSTVTITPATTITGALTNSATTTTIKHLAGSTSAPSIAAGTGAGTTPTVSVSGTDISGIVNITTGTSPAGSNAIVATVTFNTTYASAPKGVVLVPANTNAAALATTTQVFVPANGQTNGVGTTTFVVESNGTALAASTAYIWTYQIIQ